MISAALGFWFVAQTTAPTKPLELPWASSLEFRRAVVQVGALSKERKFADAARIAGRLPVRKLTFSVDWKLIKPQQRSEWTRVIDTALANWTEQLPDVKVTRVESGGDIRVSFVPKLPRNATSVGPAGSVYFVSYDPSDPRIEGVWALARTEREVPITAREIRNEVLYSVAAALGLDATPKQGMATDRNDGLYVVDHLVSTINVRTARQNLEVADRLRASVAAKRDPDVGAPRAFVDLKSKDVGTVDEGDAPIFTFQVTNPGDGPLLFNLIPDCGCFRLSFSGRVEPGKTELVRVQMDTAGFPGDHERALFLYTNDPDLEMRRIPIKINAIPMVQWFGAKEGVYVADDSGLAINLKVAINPKLKFAATRAELSGVPGMADLKPWKGVVNGRPLEGYEVNVLVSPNLVPGRLSANLRLLGIGGTEQFAPKWSFLVQKGIGVFPGGVYFGEINQTPNVAYVNLSRPGKPFKIQSVSVDNSHLKASFVDLNKREDWRIAVEFDGKGPFGPISGTLKVTTDDKAQPTILVPISGMVR